MVAFLVIRIGHRLVATGGKGLVKHSRLPITIMWGSSFEGRPPEGTLPPNTEGS